MLRQLSILLVMATPPKKSPLVMSISPPPISTHPLIYDIEMFRHIEDVAKDSGEPVPSGPRDRDSATTYLFFLGQPSIL